MIDTMVHKYLIENRDFLVSVVDADVTLYLSAIQNREIRDGLDNCSKEKKERIIDNICLVDDLADPIVTGVETSGYGEIYGRNYAGSTGEIYDELIEPHPNIREVHREDAIGAEAAINREILFVTEDRGLQEKMAECGYSEYLLTIDTFRKLF